MRFRGSAAPTGTERTTTISTTDPRSFALLRLFHLVSPALPIGAYAYSQGLEYAVHAGWVRSEAEVSEWISGLARRAIGTLDLPVLQRLYRAWEAVDEEATVRWNDFLLASRETSELRQEDRQLGNALHRILTTLGVTHSGQRDGSASAFATWFARAGVHWHITCSDVMTGYLWSWTENQVLASIKLVPLGQSAGQRLLHRLIAAMPEIVSNAASLPDDDIGVAAPSQMMAAAFHETQYTRLFRS